MDPGSGVGGGADGTPAAGDVSDPEDELATGGELARTGGIGGMGPSRGDSFIMRGGGDQGAGDGIAGGWLDRERRGDTNTWRPNINFPSFDGETDPLTWLNKCAMYFRGLGTVDDERVWMASLHLEGITAKWYYALERDVSLITWPRFTEFVNMRFGLPLRTNGLADLKDLRRTGTVEEYQYQILTLLYRCDDMMPLQ
jgi:hypothetical protein